MSEDSTYRTPPYSINNSPDHQEPPDYEPAWGPPDDWDDEPSWGPSDDDESPWGPSDDGSAPATEEAQPATTADTLPPSQPGSQPEPLILPLSDEPLSFSSEVALGQHLAGRLTTTAAAVVDRDQVRQYRPDLNGWALVHPDHLNRAAAAYNGKGVWRMVNRQWVVVPLKLSDRQVKGILSQARVHLAHSGFFDAAPPGAAFSGAFISINEGQLVGELLGREHRVMLEHVRPYSPVEADPAVEPPVRFLAFLREMWAGCPDLDARTECVFETIGAALLGQSWRYKASLLLIGLKDTGKSVLLAVISELFPSGTAASVSLHQMGRRFGAAPLVNATVNIVNELPKTALKECEAAKALLSGDPVSIERKYKDAFAFRCRCGHFFAGNEMPEVVDPALLGRLVVVDCPNVVPEAKQVKGLAEAIVRDEVAQIAAMAIRAFSRGPLKTGVITRPDTSSVWDDGNNEDDPVRAWAEERIVACSESRASVELLHLDFACWSDQREMRITMMPSAFGKRLAALGFEGGNSGGRYYKVRFAVDPKPGESYPIDGPRSGRAG